MDELQRPEVLLTYFGRPRKGRLEALYKALKESAGGYSLTSDDPTGRIELVGALSPVNHRGLHQGCRQKKDTVTVL